MSFLGDDTPLNLWWGYISLNFPSQHSSSFNHSFTIISKFFILYLFVFMIVPQDWIWAAGASTPDSLTHCAQLVLNSHLCSDPSAHSQILNPLSYSRNSTLFFNVFSFVQISSMKCYSSYNWPLLCFFFFFFCGACLIFYSNFIEI